MRIQANYSLKKRNTFKIDVKAQYLVEIEKQSDIIVLRSDLKLAALPWIIIGSASNIVFNSDLEKVVVTCRYNKINIVKEDEKNVWISVGAGLEWHELVKYSVKNNLWGLENLALIPGTVGAAPVQNIGAYGSEAQDVITRVQTLNLFTGERSEFRHSDCQFSYRNSIFKTQYENKQLVHRVTFRLTKLKFGQANLYYDPLKEALKHYDKSELTPEIVFDQIVKIRKQKLPDYKVHGNAGSFFKNPIISRDYFEELTAKFEDMPYHKTIDGDYKIPAAWLIEQAGWKGKKFSKTVGVSAKHALVLVNYGDAKGEDIIKLSTQIQEDVDHMFGIHLEREVIVIK